MASATRAPGASHCKECGTPLPERRDPRKVFCSSKCRHAPTNRRRFGGGACSECGKSCLGTVCKPCQLSLKKAKREEQYNRLEELWSAGASFSDIARELGLTAGSASALVSSARRDGRSLAYRQRRLTQQKLTKPQARAALASALKSGTIRRPGRCEGCGEEMPVEGHHTDYQRPLYVEWLCTDCHARAHGNVPRRTGATA